MARNKNMWLGTGRLGADPEIRHTQAGDLVVNLRLGSSQSWTDRNGNKKEKTFWAKVVVWGKTAEICEKYCRKGDFLRVEGPLVNREWEDRDGIKRFSTEVTITGFNGEIEFLSSPRRQPQETSSQTSYSNQRATSAPDEIPF